VKVLAERFGIARQTVFDHMRRNQVPRRYPRLGPDEIDEAGHSTCRACPSRTSAIASESIPEPFVRHSSGSALRCGTLTWRDCSS
jgi:hypothetical protein